MLHAIRSRPRTRLRVSIQVFLHRTFQLRHGLHRYPVPESRGSREDIVEFQVSRATPREDCHYGRLDSSCRDIDTASGDDFQTLKVEDAQSSTSISESYPDANHVFNAFNAGQPLQGGIEDPFHCPLSGSGLSPSADAQAAALQQLQELKTHGNQSFQTLKIEDAQNSISISEPSRPDMDAILYAFSDSRSFQDGTENSYQRQLSPPDLAHPIHARGSPLQHLQEKRTPRSQSLQSAEEADASQGTMCGKKLRLEPPENSLGCPYRIRNPAKFNVRAHITCATQPYPNISMLK